jgi:hypothetical protein
MLGKGTGGVLLQVQPQPHDRRHTDRGIQQARRGHCQGFYHEGMCGTHTVNCQTIFFSAGCSVILPPILLGCTVRGFQILTRR